MTKKRRIEITIETHEVTVAKRNGDPTDEYCSTCEVSVDAFPLTVAAGLTGATFAELAVKLESGAIHCTGGPGRSIRVCGNSLNTIFSRQTGSYPAEPLCPH